VDSPRRSNSFSTSLLSLGSIRALTVADLLILYLLTNCHKCSTNGIHNATLAIDKERTPLDDLADYVIHDEAGKALPQIAQRLKWG
jgi:NAD-dependent SIR2 family protein deacetylase